MQPGITLAGFLASATAAVTLAEPLTARLNFLGSPAPVVGIAVVTVIVTASTLVVGELAPKRLAMQHARRWAVIVASPLNSMSTLAALVVWLLGKGTDVVAGQGHRCGGAAAGRRSPRAARGTDRGGKHYADVRAWVVLPPGAAGAMTTATEIGRSRPSRVAEHERRNQMNGDVNPEPAAGGPLSEGERANLVLMREEERLARDLYRRFHQAWDVPIFGNIAASEQRHYDTIGRLLERYGVPDPSVGQPPGVYADAALQQAYDGWLARGLSSVEDACAVGVELETGDIADLTAAVEGSDKAVIHRVYENLRAASENHLRAFEGATSGRPMGGGRGVRRRGGSGCDGAHHRPGGGHGHHGGGRGRHDR
ncbi:DUF2202 domain-containing protein [Mycolicibacterium alvei]|uniref:DUF2202 domain-containing protein n=1 Tax=Mycolicibacterium alvei TaxID=67081 RepID=UPI001F2CBF28